MLPGIELMSCPSLAVPHEVMHHVVRVESSYNPYAIGVVGGRLVRQPRSLPEALATVRMLEGKGYNFSLGLAQVNRYNLAKYGLDSYEKAFEACPNLQAGSRILAECYGRSSGDWGKSFSCYYSGNFVTGYRHGYVQKVYASMGAKAAPASDGQAIAVISKPSRRSVPVSRMPLYATGRQAGPQRLPAAGAVPSPVQVTSRVSMPVAAPPALAAAPNPVQVAAMPLAPSSAAYAPQAAAASPVGAMGALVAAQAPQPVKVQSMAEAPASATAQSQGDQAFVF
ncbi:lytic transglycosylase domain-containing protein [Lysobacter sp. 5GHs7-4]|uniref:lytic transglycosylase domain-containing protein n=1 Tax=Lysobacter sp. 5GHs7-4 TaxID=2904253 RepID=UPI0031BA16C1